MADLADGPDQHGSQDEAGCNNIIGVVAIHQLAQLNIAHTS